MAATDDESSPHSSQSSLSGVPSDDDIEMRTRAKARRLAEEEEVDEEEEIADADADGSEDEEAAANGSASDDEDVEVEEEEESDELEDDNSEAEELEEGDGDDYEADEGVPVAAASKQVARTRKPPVRRVASNTSRKRKAIAELSRSASEDSSSALRVPTSKASARKITLRISPSKNKEKSKKTTTTTRDKRPRRSKTTKQQQIEDELDDDEEEEEQEEQDGGDDAEEDQDSWDDDFENDQSFAQLPKTARQLAKEKAILGTDSGSELQELPVEGSKKSKLTESELALRKSELSRRRRNQTEKKLEDDKIETINRLLKKQVTRRSNREKAGAEDSEADMEEDEATGTVEKKVVDPRRVRLDLKQTPRPFFRYIQTTQGSTLSLPVEEVGDIQPYQTKWDVVFNKQATA